eukprot:TRINITY_DN3397_c0_g1_i1.p1 TRINITY_DN3397_c0_g1~~TRINITY_DN3397_c0_g1_i1.p1  ORF type:complete len:222 (+),score=26.70 TRINITY_DN3397_c0_g1_i1:25-690(+)
MCGLGYSFNKSLIVTGNFVLFLFGLFVVGFSIYSALRFQDNSIETLNVHGYLVLPILESFFGLLIALISIVGFCGAAHANRILLSIYVTVIIILIIGQSGLTVAGFIVKKNAPEILKDNWVDLTLKEQSQLQYQFNCCGWENQTDATTTCPSNSTSGCGSTFIDEVVDQIVLFIGVSCGIILVQLLVAIFGCSLCQKIPPKNEKERTKLIKEVRHINKTYV